MKRLYLVCIVYIFMTSFAVKGQVSLIKKIIPNDETAGFGSSLDMSGNNLVIGAPIDGQLRGATYFIRNDSQSWFQQKINGMQGNDRFGASVSISRDYSVIGMNEWDDEAYYPQNLTDIYKKGESGWAFFQRLYDNESADSYQGSTVALYNDFAFVQGFKKNPQVYSAGMVQVYQKDSDDNWNYFDELTASSATEYANFGEIMDIDGNYAIIGAPGRMNYPPTAAYVFRFDRNQWIEQAKLTPMGLGESSDRIEAVAISEKYAVLGVPNHDTNGENSGGVFIWQNGEQGWELMHFLKAHDGQSNDNFGKSVAVTGDFIIVGAPGDHEDLKTTGSVYVYKLVNNIWTLYAKRIPGDCEDGASFGWSVAASGVDFVVGALGENCAYVYKIDGAQSAPNSPYPLHLPFAAGTTWQVGGNGYYYGEGGHTDANNSFFSTDWNLVGGESLGQPVYPVARGTVVMTGHDEFWGKYIEVRHGPENVYGTLKTRYCHLQDVFVFSGHVDIDVQIGTVGRTGNAPTPHLHLDFQVYNGTEYVSSSHDNASRCPSPLVSGSGNAMVLWDITNGATHFASPKQFFDDVPNGFWGKPWIDAAYTWGVMENFPEDQPTTFTPDAPVNRAWLAVFWVKAHHEPYNIPPAATGIFEDVPPDYWAAPYIEQLYNDGFTAGCSTEPLLYCPERNVTRAEMAVFILRAMYGNDIDPAPATGNVFDDIPAEGEWYSRWVERLATEGITSGCSAEPPLFCPDNPVTRAEMAVFLLRAFGKYPPILGGYGGPAEHPSTWELNLTVADAGDETTTLTFGQGPSATIGVDEAFGEAELPPLPPSGIFDARMELPTIPPIGSVKDFRSNTAEKTTWTIAFQPGAAGYPIELNWDIDEFPEGDFYLKDAITGTIINVNMKSQDSYTVTNSGIHSLKIENSSLATRTVNTAAGWNIISVPTRLDNMSTSELFPSAESSAYGFENGYVTTDVLQNGMGYWLKFSAATTVDITGYKVKERQVPVRAGWNLVGPLETDVNAYDITWSPNGIVQSEFFGFDRGYKSANLLKVGKGYWVKVSTDGFLEIPAMRPLNKALQSSSDYERIKDSWPKLIIMDNEGSTGLLYLSPSNDVGNEYELPPLPPKGIFDVRFNSDRYVESIQSSNLVIVINSAKFPIILKVEKLGDLSLVAKSSMGSELLNEPLLENQQVTITQPLSRLALSISDRTQIPTQYELSQNYPNPFNPTTTIKFALPEAGHVRISVYNTLGKKVIDLVEREFDAGYHQIEFDGQKYSSGIYFYSLQVGNYKAIKKMILVR